MPRPIPEESVAAAESEQRVVRLPWRDYTLVTLPMCASETGVPRAGVLGGFLANEFDHDHDQLIRSALAQIRKNGIEHHGRDLLPDADDPNDANWFLICVEKESAVYSLHFKSFEEGRQANMPTGVLKTA